MKGSKAYVATVRAESGLLLGGAKTHQSAPFEAYTDAVAWADTIVRTNQQAGRTPVHDGIRIVTMGAIVYDSRVIPASAEARRIAPNTYRPKTDGNVVLT